jgi:hypothetical protein
MGNTQMLKAIPLKNRCKQRNASKCNAACTAIASAAALGASLLSSLAQAGGTINIGPDQSVSVGFGLRTHFASIEDGAPDGDGRSKDFELESVRLYMGASLNKYIKATFNTEKKGDNSVQVIDAIAQFEPMSEFNVWMGRMLPPTDRSNLDGPYYLLAWDYPGIVSRYPGYAVGRDDGLLAWGNIDKKVVYSVGAFQGHNNVAGASSESGNLLYAGRVAVNLWEPELAPAYYTGSTYYGAANIFTIGLVYQMQSDGAGTAADKGDFSGYNIDMLFETKDTGSGSVTLEGAYYHYDTDDVVDNPTNPGGDFNVGGLTQGDAYLLGAAYLFPQQVGMGKFQPYARYQSFETDLPGDDTEITRYDLGVNYVIAGPNAKISLAYFSEDDDVDDFNGVTIGVQLQF